MRFLFYLVGLIMLTSLNYKLYRPSRSRLTFTRQVRQTCLAEFRQDTLQWQQCENGINHALRSCLSIDSLDDIYNVLSQGTMHYFHSSNNCRPGGITSYVAQKCVMLSMSHCKHSFKNGGTTHSFTNLNVINPGVCRRSNSRKSCS